MRGVVDGLPYLAGGWVMRDVQGRRPARGGRAAVAGLAPHVRRFPDRAPEWVIAAVGNAEVCPGSGTPRRPA